MASEDLNALVGSRICHDLISPIGAIGNGIELLTMSGAGNQPEIALIAESVENANARIRYFRIAFGAARPGAEIGQNEVASIIRDMFRSGRTQVDWRVDGTSARTDVKLAFLLLLCLENTLPWGGQITVVRSGNNWKLEAKGEKIKVEKELWDILTTPQRCANVVAADVHFALVPDAAKVAGRTVATFLGPNQVTLSF